MKTFNKPLYYILNIVWGFPMTLIGAIAAVGLLIIGKRPTRHGGCFHFRIGRNWGGINLGLVFLTDETAGSSTCHHEYGHSLQNAMFGPFMPFIVGIPSAIRYWVFTIREKKHKVNPPYDSIWFEGTATKWGTDTMHYWNKI